MGVEKTYVFFCNLHIYSNLQKYNNLRTMPLCAIVFHYVPINYRLVTNLVTPRNHSNMTRMFKSLIKDLEKLFLKLLNFNNQVLMKIYYCIYTLFNEHRFPRLPCFFKPRFKWAVKSEYSIPSFTRYCLYPIVLHAYRSFRCKINIV